jgi:hypothetical protein
MIRNMSDKCLPTRTVCKFHLYKFLVALLFYTDIGLNENIIQDLPTNWIIGILEVYKQLMNWFVEFPFFFKYLMHAQYVINS